MLHVAYKHILASAFETEIYTFVHVVVFFYNTAISTLNTFNSMHTSLPTSHVQSVCMYRYKTEIKSQNININC